MNGHFSPHRSSSSFKAIAPAAGVGHHTPAAQTVTGPTRDDGPFIGKRAESIGDLDLHVYRSVALTDFNTAGPTLRGRLTGDFVYRT